MSAGIGAVAQVASALFLTSGRSIGPFVPHVIIEEQHRDDSVITEFPVEIGAAITDHTYERPPSLVLRIGWSDSTAGIPGYVRIIYQQLLALKASRQPFTVATGKRLYQEMLFAALDVITDAGSENALMVIAALRKINRTSTQATNPNTAKPAQDNANQANPQSTGTLADRGAIQTSPVSPTGFAGAYNPGSLNPINTLNTAPGIGPGGYNLDGTPTTGQGFGLNTPGADIPLAQNPNLTGLSPPTEITLPQLSVTTPEPIGGLQGAGPDQYNMFGGGP